VAELKPWDDLPVGGAVIRAQAPRPQTGGWRTGVKPAVDLSRCVNCLLCWLYCPDSAVLLDGTTFTGFDYDYCKGCEICAEMCPVQAIEMVPEETQL
jgi:2-oxoacid:acceptor oxidoreductase delta subunit (pyruvate/2-ketoisovalerate family)